MTQLIALIVATGVGYLSHLLVGDHLSFFSDFMVGTVVSGAAYVACVYWLKQLRP